MNLEKALFISNSRFISANALEGGVKSCTDDFLNILRTVYEIQLFAIEFHDGIQEKVVRKIGLKGYNRYAPEKYIIKLKEILISKQIKVVFLNTANTIEFSRVLKSIDSSIKVVLCSHGNESGDYLHDVVLDTSKKSRLKKLIQTYNLGNYLYAESKIRRESLDATLAVSPIEVAIEKWLGAKKAIAIHPTIEPEFIDRKSLGATIGFIGDLSHLPNFSGVTNFCKEIVRQELQNEIKLKLVGKSTQPGEQLKEMFPFIELTGYLDQEALILEMKNWSFFLNAVYYYSKGISTKLSLAMKYGIPALSTVQGNRGYEFTDGKIMNVETVSEQVDQLKTLIFNVNEYERFYEDFLLASKTTPNKLSQGERIKLAINPFNS
ncbi:MAG: glycosyltransferase [Bacteroidetes bacterium]|nr:glycosyltransferase [Bacteroidota bacterium]